MCGSLPQGCPLLALGAPYKHVIMGIPPESLNSAIMIVLH